MEGKAINGSESFRDASFSYLRSDHRPSAATSARPSFSADRKPKSSAGYSEISVFAAERYFNTPIHQPRPDPTRSDLRSVRPPGTPSACSEGSRSTALLLNHGDDAAVGLRRRRRRRRWTIAEGSRSFFATLGCTGGACSDDKSVFVSAADDRRHVDDDEQQQGAQLGQNHHHPRLRYEARSTKRPEDHFAFPILSAAAAEAESKSSAAAEKDSAAEEPPRMSLEVFGSNKESSSAVDEVASNLERKLSVLTWDAIPAAGGKPYGGGSKVSPKTGMSDLDSDGSSDLFEIENITAAAQRVSGEGYEPSEASIEWSVVTASADVGGCGGDYDEKTISANSRRNTAAPGKRMGMGMGMLGCKSQKSVRVAENALRATSASSAKEN